MNTSQTRHDKAPARGWFFPPRTLGQLMSVVALSGLALAALGPQGGRTTARPRRWATTPRLWLVSPYLPSRPTIQDSPFIVAAPEGLDTRFVVAAPQGIDDGIIAVPDGPAFDH